MLTSRVRATDCAEEITTVYVVSQSSEGKDIATIPAFFKAGHMTPFIGFLISIVVSFVLGMVLTMIVGFKEDNK